MLRLPLLSRLLLSSVLLLSACGPFAAEKVDHRSEKPNASGPEEPVDGKPVADPAPAEKPAAEKPRVSTEPKTPQKETIYDETLDRTATHFFYQSSAELSDLFAPNGTSQLCWPTALAYTLESLRVSSEPPLSKLQKPSVRELFAACDTDKKIGTTMPQGVTCADAKIAGAGYQPNLKVTGVDAKWKKFGLYPQTTTATESVVTPTLLRKILTDGSSAILFVGYYRFDRAKGTWGRTRGHFVSITGFGYRAEWDGEVIDLHVVNPGHDYRAESPDDPLAPDVVRMSPLSGSAAKLPEVGYELKGPLFELGEDAVASVESVLEIQPK